MATQRYVSTSFWDDEWIQTLVPDEKLLYLYYLTSPLTNIAGVYKITVKRVCFDTGFNSDTIGHMMRKFEKAGKVLRFGEYIVVPNWPKHQKASESPKVLQGIERVLSGVSPECIGFLVHCHYSFDLSGYPMIPYRDPSNYSDSDLDFNFDLSEDNAAPQNVTPQKPSSPAKAVDPLYQPIQQSFLSQGNFADYKKEGTCIKAIIKKIRSLTPDKAEDTAQKILETFRVLTNGNDKFWKDCPFLPSALSPRLEQVWTIAQKGSAKPSMDWFDELAKQHEARRHA